MQIIHFAPKTQNNQPGDDGEGTMMVHSRRRSGLHGHQAMESTNYYRIEDDSEALYYVLAVFFSIFACLCVSSFLP
jgi:hypothetical protein